MLFATGSSIALSLGKYRGAALVGRPLDISVQVVLGPQDDPAALCVEADAFYADNKLDKSQVRVSTEKALANPLDIFVRIRSSVLVDEPVVNLNVRVGCQQKTERRYVILADLVSESASLPLQLPGSGAGASGASGTSSALPSPSTARAASAAVRSKNARLSAASSDGSSSGPDTTVAAQATAPTSPKQGTTVPKRDKLPASGAGAAGQNVLGKARLKLEPLDMSIERDPQLKSSTQLLSVPAAGEPQRAAAAALWRALQAQPQDILRDAEKAQSLENSLNTLRTQTQKNQLALNELNSQLEKMRSEQSVNWLIYALGALLILALAGVVYLWRLRSLADADSAHELPWWRRNKHAEKGWTNNVPESAFSASVDPASARSTSSRNLKESEKRNGRSTHALLNPDSMLGADEPTFTEVKHISGLDSHSHFSHSSSLDFTTSGSQLSRSVKAEELFDVQQQADFFVSLGQYDQAVDLLRGHIAANIQADIQTSPLVYLDLFSLYHQLERRTDYEALRYNFNQLFTANLPVFDLYTHGSAGLDAYPVVLTRVQALWPSPEALEVIEECILRKPVTGADTFDLEAYRELLLLYAMAKELSHSKGNQDPDELRFDLPGGLPADSATRASGFPLTAIQPVAARVGESITRDMALLLPPQSPRLALDVNLDEPAEIANAPPLPGVGMQSSPNPHLFARLDTEIPMGPSAQPPAGGDNLIDFDGLDDFIKNSDPAGPSKA